MREANRPRRGRELSLGLAAAAASAAVLLSGALGSTATEVPAGAWHRYADRHDALSVAVPPGWHRAGARLVPRLLMPREILSVGNFPMPVGGGGNCDREPIAAIRRMRAGDALITVQEYAVTPAMRAHLGRSYPPRRELRIGRLNRPAARTGAPAPISFATIPFSEDGRAFDALVYLAGRPASRLRGVASRVLEGMRFGPRT